MIAFGQPAYTNNAPAEGFLLATNEEPRMATSEERTETASPR
jgi:hypothetical protein